jgi:NAD(P)-dependent dehydrogenase (short-subunit alcohol dehydrogenase family)
MRLRAPRLSFDRSPRRNQKFGDFAQVAGNSATPNERHVGGHHRHELDVGLQRQAGHVEDGVGARPGLIDAYSDEEWERVVRTNLTGAFHCAREAFRQMRVQSPQGGRIINNGSVSAQAPRPGSLAYTATKHALTGLTKSLSLDGRPFRIACGQIDTGNAETDLAAPMKAGVPQADGTVRAEPVMDVRHVADAVLYMAGLPLEANVQSMTVLATAMPSHVGRG